MYAQPFGRVKTRPLTLEALAVIGSTLLASVTGAAAALTPYDDVKADDRPAPPAPAAMLLQEIPPEPIVTEAAKPPKSPVRVRMVMPVHAAEAKVSDVAAAQLAWILEDDFSYLSNEKTSLSRHLDASFFAVNFTRVKPESDELFASSDLVGKGVMGFGFLLGLFGAIRTFRQGRKNRPTDYLPQ